MPKQLTVHGEVHGKVVRSKVMDAEANVASGRRPHAWKREAPQGGRSMAKEPGNLVLKMLREIRATLDKHEQRFDKIDQRLDQVDKKLDAVSESLTTSLGLSLHANIRHESVKRQLDALDKRVKRLEERV
jgi:tetrahydromethanopterin S-methyltransferase subunit G